MVFFSYLFSSSLPLVYRTFAFFFAYI